MKPHKPKVITKCVADHYALPDERIIEVTNGERSQEKHKGALISISNLSDGTLNISVYRADVGVRIMGPSAASFRVAWPSR